MSKMLKVSADFGSKTLKAPIGWHRSKTLKAPDPSKTLPPPYGLKTKLTAVGDTPVVRHELPISVRELTNHALGLQQDTTLPWLRTLELCVKMLSVARCRMTVLRLCLRNFMKSEMGGVKFNFRISIQAYRKHKHAKVLGSRDDAWRRR